MSAETTATYCPFCKTPWSFGEHHGCPFRVLAERDEWERRANNVGRQRDHWRNEHGTLRAERDTYKEALRPLVTLGECIADGFDPDDPDDTQCRFTNAVIAGRAALSAHQEAGNTDEEA